MGHDNRAGYFFILLGGIVILYTAFLVPAHAAGAAPAMTFSGGASPPEVKNQDPYYTPSAWLEKDADGKAKYIECGQECTYQKANEGITVQTRFIKQKALKKYESDQNDGAEKYEGSDEEAYDRLMLLKAGGAMGRNSRNAADLRSIDEKGESRKLPSILNEQSNTNLTSGQASAQKAFLPTVPESKDVAREIQKKIKLDSLLHKTPQRITRSEFDRDFKPSAAEGNHQGDLLTFKEVARDPSDANGEKMWTAEKTQGSEYQKAEADYKKSEGLGDKAYRYLYGAKVGEGLQAKISKKYEEISKNGLPKNRASTLEDYLVDSKSAEHFRESRESVVKGINEDLESKHAGRTVRAVNLDRKPTSQVRGEYGILPVNSGRSQSKVNEAVPTDEKKLSIYLTENMGEFDASKYDQFKDRYMKNKMSDPSVGTR